MTRSTKPISKIHLTKEEEKLLMAVLRTEPESPTSPHSVLAWNAAMRHVKNALSNIIQPK